MFAKKFLSYVVLPLPGVLILLIVGIALLWFTSRQRTGKVLVTVGCSLLLLFSSGLVSGWYVGPLKRSRPLATLAQAPGARWIVILGGGYADAAGAPALSRLGPQALERLVEGVRLYRSGPGARLVVSGGVVSGVTGQAEVMAQAAEALGVPGADIVREDRSMDTQDEARLVGAIVGDDPFVLVTSTMHMRRAVALFEKQGKRPVPAPAGHWSHASSLLPSSGQLSTAAEAEHEYLGMLWSRLRGTI